MKNLLVFSWLLIVFCVHMTSSTNKLGQIKILQDTPIDTSTIINKIRLDFERINSSLIKYRKETFDIFDLSAEGGKATAYYDQNRLKKIHAVFYGEMGRVEIDHYFSNEQLFFVYKKRAAYDRPMYINGSKIKSTIENRYYIDNKSIVLWLVGSKPNRNSNALKATYLAIENELAEIMDKMKNN